MCCSGSLIYFYLNGGVISEIIPAFCNEISAGKSEMRWNLNEHLAKSVFNLIWQVPIRVLVQSFLAEIFCNVKSVCVFNLSTHRFGTLLKPKCISHHHQQVFPGQATVGQWTGHGRQSSVSVLPGSSQPVSTGQVRLERKSVYPGWPHAQLLRCRGPDEARRFTS